MVSSRENGDGCHTETAEPLDLTPEQGAPFGVFESSNKTVKLNNVETRKISKLNDADTKPNISSTINNDLKACSESCVNNLFETRDVEVLEYGPHLENQGGGDNWATDRSQRKSVEIPSVTNEKDDWKSCAICLEEVEKGLKNHKGCSCFLCDSCIEVSFQVMI